MLSAARTYNLQCQSHLYSAAWSLLVLNPLTASGGRCGGTLAASAAGLRGSDDLALSNLPLCITIVAVQRNNHEQGILELQTI